MRSSSSVARTDIKFTPSYAHATKNPDAKIQVGIASAQYLSG